MLHLQQGVARSQSHLSPYSPVHPSANETCVSSWKADFSFWGDQESQVCDDKYDVFGHEEEADFQAQSPPLWTSSSRSPLLAGNHRNRSYPPHKSRLQAILDGRRNLMKLIQGMPESSYELSLKDIVDEKHSQEADHPQHKDIDNRSSNFKPPQVKMNQYDKMNGKARQITRSQSMDSGVFLLRLFFPISLGLKRKSTAAANPTKFSLRQSPNLEESEKTADKDYWRKIRFLTTGNCKNKQQSNCSRSTSSSTSRSENIDFTPSCWSFHKK
ncbi:hypothetical protein NMG60_11007033 [Bertholletia excelsa]